MLILNNKHLYILCDVWFVRDGSILHKPQQCSGYLKNFTFRKLLFTAYFYFSNPTVLYISLVLFMSI